jgi:hypothetical protein
MYQHWILIFFGSVLSFNPHWMLMYFLGLFFWISPYVSENSRYSCGPFLTLRISVISDVLQGLTFVLTARYKGNCTQSFSMEPSWKSLVSERARRAYWASPNTLTDDAHRWTGYYLWAESKESAYSRYHQCRPNLMGCKLEGQVHGLPKIYSHSSHVEWTACSIAIPAWNVCVCPNKYFVKLSWWSLNCKTWAAAQP